MAMPELEESINRAEGGEDLGNVADSGPWQKELALADKFMKKFWERGRRVVKRYMDEGETSDSTTSKTDTYNIFWANVGVLKASLYANQPKPIVKRQWDDFMDDVGRVGGIMMERLIQQGFEQPESDMNVAFTQCVEDRLLPGLGQVWLRYEPEISSKEITPAVKDRKGKVIKEAEVEENIDNEYVCTDYVYWEDFWFSPCRQWGEVRWGGRRVWMTHGEFDKRFGSRFAKLVSWTKKDHGKIGERVTPENMGIEKTEVFEIWHKSKKMVYWISRSCNYILDSKADPLELKGFFPFPKPILATHTTSNPLPKADYLMVQSQYARLQNLSARIGLLEDAIQASGVYDKSSKELSQLLPGNGTNRMIPVDNWAMFAEKGGMKGVVDWFPLEMIVNALDKLREMKADAKAELFELTGMSDIMRGETNPREALGTQKMKAQYSSVRLQYLQGEVAQFIQDTLRIKAEIITNHFQIETIIRNSLIELTPDADLAVEAAEMIKDEWQACYRIQVFADTLAIPDYNAEQEGRTEFLTATGQFISQIMPLIEAEPQSGPYLLRMLQWGAASFRSSATIEGVFDKAIAAMEEKLKNPPQQAPDPNMVKAQAHAQATQNESGAKVQAINAKTQAELARKGVEIQESGQRVQSELQKDAMVTAANISATISQAKVTELTTKAKTQEQIRASREKTAAQIAAITAKAAAKPTKGK